MVLYIILMLMQESLEKVLSTLASLSNLRELQIGNNPCTPVVEKE